MRRYTLEQEIVPVPGRRSSAGARVTWPSVPFVETRVARGDDVGAALEVWRASLATAGARPSAARSEQVQAQLAAPDALLVVAGQPDEVCGLALGTWVPDGEGAFVPGLLRLALLVVHPRVRRAGVGGQLADGLADAGWVRGARRLVSTPADPVAQAFLEACGLEPTGNGDLVGELEPPVREVVAREQGLRLGQLLKLAGLVETGAEAKALLAAGGVEVNGEVELRRGRQVSDGDVVLARDAAVRVVLAQD